MSLLEIGKDKLYLDGKEFYLAAGDMHYFRVFKDGWKRRLLLMKDFGLTAVQTYMPWNLHEPEEGKFDFSGMLDIEAFLSLCDQIGLKVILRCSPYLCGEWDFGGLPSWLLKNDEIALRCSDQTYMNAVERYSKEVCRRVVPYLSTNDGPIILFGLENEYGSFGTDLDYIDRLALIYRENGVDVPFLTANGPENFKLYNGTPKKYWTSIDTHAINIEKEIEVLRGFQPDKPVYISEMWDGRAMMWKGGKFVPRDGKQIAGYYKKALNSGAYVSFYMFCGGTNFGFLNGANIVKHPYDPNVPKKEIYYPMMTSYDVNAAVTENGEPTEKYFLLRDELDEYLGKEKRPHIAPEYKTQKPQSVSLNCTADFFCNIENLTEKFVESGNTKSMEFLGQSYGFILYSTNIRFAGDYPYHLVIDGLHDRATIYLDGEYLGTYMRDEERDLIKFRVKSTGSRLDILVENTGRINYGRAMMERKGIVGSVYLKVEMPNGDFLYNRGSLYNWEIRTIPLKNVFSLEFDGKAVKNKPAVFKGEFKAQEGIDTFLDMQKWKKGVVFVNGFNLGRYWSIGSQQTLYVPGELIKSDNTIEVFELYPDPNINEIEFSEKHYFSDVDEIGWNESIGAPLK